MQIACEQALIGIAALACEQAPSLEERSKFIGRREAPATRFAGYCGTSGRRAVPGPSPARFVRRLVSRGFAARAAVPMRACAQARMQMPFKSLQNRKSFSLNIKFSKET